jgi:polar amino acid transport system substrate-binding protein
VTHTRLRSPRVLLATATAAALLSSCGGKTTAAPPVEPGVTESPSASATESPMPTVSADPALAKKVPSEIAKSGTIDVGTDSTYAPSEFLAEDGKTVQGFDVDLFTAVAAKLGLKARYVTAPFGNIIPSVQSGKYGIGVSSFTIGADRLKQADMVSYFSAGTQWATAAGNPAKVSLDDACGKRVAVQADTVQVKDATARSDTCTKAGKKAIALDQFQKQDQATAAVVSGKDDAMLADSPVIAYAAKQTGGRLEALGAIYDSAPYGYVLKKGSTTFAHAIADAVNALIADGTYKQLLARWGVEDGAVKTSQVDPKV